MNLGAILGGLGGLLIPGGGALTAALGSGLGSLLSGSDPKNAIKDALLGGGVGGLFGGAIAGTGMGQQVSAAMAKQGLANPMLSATAQEAAKNKALEAIVAETAKEAATSGLMGNLPLYTLGAGILGATQDSESGDLTMPEGYGGDYDKSGFLKDLYRSRYTGQSFDTSEERDAYDSEYEQKFGYDYARGGLIEGPGTGTSDDIPAMIYQDGQPVQEAALSNGEVVLSLKDLKNIGNGDAEKAGRVIGDAPNGTRGEVAAKMFASMNGYKMGPHHG